MRSMFGQNLYVSMAALILVNLVPIIGVLYWGWDVGMLMGLYWIENLIIGFFNLPKMWMCQGTPRNRVTKIIVFILHFGIFAAVHGAAIGQLFLGGAYPLILLGDAHLHVMLAGLFLSHCLSFIINFIGGREFEHRTADRQMSQPYGRVMILHLVIIAGGFVVEILNQPIFALLILIAVKTVIDLAAHRAEHKALLAAL